MHIFPDNTYYVKGLVDFTPEALKELSRLGIEADQNGVFLPSAEGWIHSPGNKFSRGLLDFKPAP